ncbi:MAG: TadE/TadG family type IV pilus assembly protein [Thermoguttaceae bacterium]
MSRSSSAPRRLRRGLAAVECAMLLPFLCLAFLVSIDYCRIFYCSITVDNCARNGALYGSADGSHAEDTGGIETAAKADASNLNLQMLSVSSAISGGNPSEVAVTVHYPFTTIMQYPGIPRQTDLTRTVRMSVLPQTPNFSH